MMRWYAYAPIFSCWGFTSNAGYRRMNPLKAAHKVMVMGLKTPAKRSPPSD